MKWLIVYGPLLEIIGYALLSYFWVDKMREIRPLIILQLVLYVGLITPLLIWGYYLKH
ncbi:hypothetical protein [Priestia koreensis]|uniref:hypothetical protein n=1 Tax=Priestia koreensis TaxID=284581 RepID=UPI000A411F31|nr:hypothetical protein [Priestia koreensis]MCM3004993.1 hypothetical protein [Priestia koreensis]UNL82987.1 hypothetical protein IE339_12330 [Priestia koreensis]